MVLVGRKRLSIYDLSDDSDADEPKRTELRESEDGEADLDIHLAGGSKGRVGKRVADDSGE